MPATPTDSEASFVLVPEGSKSSSDAEKKTFSIHRSDGIPAIALESKVSRYLSARQPLKRDSTFLSENASLQRSILHRWSFGSIRA